MTLQKKKNYILLYCCPDDPELILMFFSIAAMTTQRDWRHHPLFLPWQKQGAWQCYPVLLPWQPRENGDFILYCCHKNPTKLWSCLQLQWSRENVSIVPYSRHQDPGTWILTEYWQCPLLPPLRSREKCPLLLSWEPLCLLQPQQAKDNGDVVLYCRYCNPEKTVTLSSITAITNQGE